MKFRTELWRIVKFLLITAAVNLLLMFLMLGIYRALLNSGVSAGVAAAVHSYGQLLLSTTLLTLLHRQFTFRATEKWFIALPIMLIAAFGWQFLSSLALSIMTAAESISPTQDDFAALVNLRSGLWIVLSYLLQRCVIYCHTTDTNGWYRRLHPTNDEKECVSHE